MACNRRQGSRGQAGDEHREEGHHARGAALQAHDERVEAVSLPIRQLLHDPMNTGLKTLDLRLHLMDMRRPFVLAAPHSLQLPS